MSDTPTWYWKAAAFEKTDSKTGVAFTWVQNESLQDLAKPDRVAEIKADYVQRGLDRPSSDKPRTLAEVFNPGEDDDEGCTICHL